MTAYSASNLGDTPSGGLSYQTLFAVASVLFVSTLLLNILGTWVMRRFRRSTNDPFRYTTFKK